VATTTLDELIEQTREKANVQRSNFVTDTAIVALLNEAGKQLREEIITADDSYYQATLDFSVGAQPDNEQELPATFWKMRGLDAFAGDSLRQTEVYAREFRNRFDPGIGYYFGGDGNSIVICGSDAPQANPFRLSFVPKPLPLAPGATRTFAVHGADQPGTAGPGPSAAWLLTNAAFTAADEGGYLTPAFAAPNEAWNIPYLITTVFSGTAAAVSPDPNLIGVFSTPPSGTAYTITTQPADTRNALDVTEDNFSEYYSVRAAMVIARKKRQDSLVSQLLLERKDIEARIAALSRMRQSEPQQAPVLQRPDRGVGDWEL
jgi:hypothetical protein